ncbi:MAG: protein kinase, partial [Planctomycetaceae bacterium]|nr:protein kinase [Planctomycetaceae bacterium]
MAPAPADELSIAERIDLQCDRFEAEFASDKRPRLEEFLGDVAESVRLPLFRGLLELELELRRRAGELPQRDDYAKRFEPYASIVDLVFAELNAGPSRRFSARSAARDSSVKGTAADTSQGPSRPAPAEPSPPLTQVARFLIEKRLGEGAFGAVYKARDPQLDRDVALKVPHAGALSSKDDRERFLREARAAAGLHHANICPVHEVGTTSDGRDYIVMAFIDGKPLSKVLQSGAKLTERQIASVVRKLAQALDEAHQKGVIHRDLKPANIMINRKGEPVIMDFGLARRASPSDPQLSHSGQIMGTPAYMSPEQARGDTKTVGPATDVYSLGIVLYEMLCGQRPFSGTVTEVIGSILHVEAPPPSQFREGIDPKLQAICMKAIAKKPADRYASMKDFAAALTDFIKAGATASAAPASAASSEPLVTNEFARLMEAVSADVESKVNRAVRSVARQHRTPTWWTYLAGSGVVGVIVLLGILFFIRKDTVTVIVNIPIDVNDPSLSFFLDKTSIGADALSAPIELKPGEHELVVNRDQQLFKRFVFSVGKGESGEVKVQDVTPTSAPESPMPTRDEDWVDLFNGRDLAGWQGNPAHWSV